MAAQIWSIIALVASVGLIVVVWYFILTGRHDRDPQARRRPPQRSDRDHDEAARDYFSAHGHWPDEDPAP